MGHFFGPFFGPQSGSHFGPRSPSYPAAGPGPGGRAKGGHFSDHFLDPKVGPKLDRQKDEFNEKVGKFIEVGPRKSSLFGSRPRESERGGSSKSGGTPFWKTQKTHFSKPTFFGFSQKWKPDFAKKCGSSNATFFKKGITQNVSTNMFTVINLSKSNNF